MRRIAVILLSVLCAWVSLDAQEVVDLSQPVVLKEGKDLFYDDFDFLKIAPSGFKEIFTLDGIKSFFTFGKVKVNVVYGKERTAGYSLENVSGAYTVEITPKEILIAGHDEAGAFYGIQALRRMVEDAGDEKKVSAGRFKDSPDLALRGLAEGYYGDSWTDEYRSEIVRLMALLKMNTYLYIPSEDGDVGKLEEICRENRVELVVGDRADAILGGYYVPRHGGEFLKMTLYGAAERMWDRNSDSEELMDYALDKMIPDTKGAWRNLLTHTNVAQGAFPVADSYEFRLITMGDYRQDEYDDLVARFRNMEESACVMASPSDNRMHSEMKQVTDEFGKLAVRCRKVLGCLKYYTEGDVSSFWETYVSNLTTDEDLASCADLLPGTESLQRYYEYMMDELHKSIDRKYTEKDYRHFKDDGMDTFIDSDGAEVCRIFMNNPEGQEVIIRLADGTGRYTAEFCTCSSDFEFDMKEDAMRVEVLGGLEVFEIMFE